MMTLGEQVQPRRVRRARLIRIPPPSGICAAGAAQPHRAKLPGPNFTASRKAPYYVITGSESSFYINFISPIALLRIATKRPRRGIYLLDFEANANANHAYDEFSRMVHPPADAIPADRIVPDAKLRK